MKYHRLIKITIILAILMILAACSKKDVDSDSNNGNNLGNEIEMTVERIDKYKGMEISDWLDENTLILAKDNTDFEKMNLLEMAEFYPRGIYIYHLDTKEFEQIISIENMFLGGAKVSPDKNHLLFYEYSIGDTAYFLLGMNENKEYSVKDRSIGIAMTADWDDDSHVVGVSYAGGAYISDTEGNITQIEGLEDQLFLVEKLHGRIYYVTLEDNFRLFTLDLETNEKKDLKIDNIDRINISPDGKNILIIKWDGDMKNFDIYDTEGNIIHTIAEGSEISDATWSMDSKMIAYHLSSVKNGEDNGGLYVYDILTNKSMEITKEEIGSVSISWSPSGDKIAVSELKDSSYDSRIIYLKLK